MLTTEEIFWYTVALISILLILYYLFYYQNTEGFEKKKKKEPLIGQEIAVNAISLHRMLHNIIPLRDQIHWWVVKVPLTPFRAPLIELPPVEKLSNFLLYNLKELTPIRNQGDCGSCWAFALTDMLSDRAMVVSGGRFRKNLSVQQLLSCFDTNGCDGQSPEEAAYWLMDNNTKLFTEKAFPYKQISGGEVFTKCPKNLKGYQVGIEPNSIKSIVEFIPEKGYNKSVLNRNIQNMKRTLHEFGPFYCAMAVYDDFFSYTGLEPYKPGKNAGLVGGHAINVVGYCDKGVDTRKKFKDTAYWICRNSWGTSWPLQTALDGYFTIVMGENICGIESRCGFATPMVYGPKYKGTPKKIEDLRWTSFKKYIEEG